MTAPNPGRTAYGQLADLLAEQEKRIGKLEQRARITQLGQASIVDSTLPLLDSLGRVKMLLGRQTDGTFAVSYANGDPPPPPAGLTINAGELVYVVGWDGSFVGGRDKPGDFARLDIHEHNTDPDFEPTGATVVGSLTVESAVSIFTGADTVYVKVVAVSLSDVPSVPTEAATVTPYPVSRIAAGSVGALELAAELAILGELILGLDPAYSKIKLGPDGLRKIEPDGSVSLYLGAGPNAPNYLSVIDPATGAALASISADGTMTARRFAVAEELTAGGENVSDQIGQKPSGLVTWWEKTVDNMPVTSEGSEVGIGEIRFLARPGAIYRVMTSPMLCNTSTGDGVMQATIRLNGQDTVSTLSNTQQISFAAARHAATCVVSKVFLVLQASAPASQMVRLLLTQYATPGSGGGRFRVPSVSPIQVWVEEIRPSTQTGSSASEGTTSDGSGSAGDPRTRVTRRWPALWSGSWASNGSKRSNTGQEMHVGNSGDGNGLHKAAVGFDFADIQADLASVTIHNIRLYLYANWWFHNDGGWMVIGLHNSPATSSPDAYPGRSHGPYPVTPKYGKPEGRWIDLSTVLTTTQFNVIANALKTGAAQGFVLDRTGMEVNATYPETAYAGRINGAVMERNAALEITYTTS